MIEKTHGIVFNYIKYKETSIIVKIYTRRFGLKSFIVNGIRSKKAKKSIGNFQPFTLLDLQVYYHENKDLLRLSDAKILYSTPNISQNITKSAIALFLTEILSKTLHHEHHENNQLYHFLHQSIIELDQLSVSIEDFHLYFLIRFSSHLGFAISSTQQIKSYDLKPEEQGYLNLIIQECAQTKLADARIFTSGKTRKNCLEAILSYYREHIEGFNEIKSLQVLHQIFH
jgi:DNA repair protein RecO (recombination protein O)